MARRTLGTLALACVCWSPAHAQQSAPHRYDVEYPAVRYSTTGPSDAVARLQRRLDRDEARLRFDEDGRGYLASLLSELDIDPASQLLVFSKTSAQIGFITPETPRALYYSDDVYVAWPPGSSDIEIASMDPNLGPVFYTLAQEEPAEIRVERRMDACLSCHDSYSLTGGGVPRFIVGSGFTDDRGEQVSHEGWVLVDDRTPLRRRWGGWYVTGSHGAQTHMGNWIIRDPRELSAPDLERTGNVTELAALLDTEPYLEDHSDIVAAMILDHQTRVQNVITRVSFDTRTLLAERGLEDTAAGLPRDIQAQVEAIAEPLIEALLMVGSVELTDVVSGTSGFAATFVEQGPFDAEGRTLRELDLSSRLFRYPCSYLIYSDAFDALPLATRTHISRRLSSILSGTDTGVAFAHLTPTDRQAIAEILRQTKPDFVALGGG